MIFQALIKIKKYLTLSPFSTLDMNEFMLSIQAAERRIEAIPSPTRNQIAVVLRSNPHIDDFPQVRIREFNAPANQNLAVFGDGPPRVLTNDHCSTGSDKPATVSDMHTGGVKAFKTKGDNFRAKGENDYGPSYTQNVLKRVISAAEDDTSLHATQMAKIFKLNKHG